MQAFVPKNRKPKFELSLYILDLNNIPLIAGSAYVKWHLPSSSAAEHRGKTSKAHIKEHKASFEYSKHIPVRLTIDKHQSLQECEIHFEIVQEYFESAKGGRVTLGNVRLNLAGYTQPVPEIAPQLAPEGQDEEGIVTRRYLMQDSKVNATLRVGIRMKQLEGDTNFISPPLKSAMVIGGIAGIMNTETGESEDMPSITAKTRELSETQDIYRRTLAATWACQNGELPPDRLVEDLFAGGNGGKMDPPPPSRRFGHTSRHSHSRDSSDSNNADGERRPSVQTMLHSDSPKHGHRRGHSGGDGSTSHGSLAHGISGRGSIEQQLHLSQNGRHKARHEPQEVTEFDIRDDLKSWQVRVS